MNEVHLSIKNLSYTYPDGTHALKNVSMDILKGQKVAIMGPNGAGKSTLFSHFNGLTEPKSGYLEIDGKKMEYDKKTLLEIRQKVGIVFQDPNDQLFAPTVKEDVAFGPMNLGLDYEEVEKRVNEALELVGMKKFKDKKFAAKCDRELIKNGCAMMGMEVKEVSEICINAMRPFAAELGLGPKE